MPSLGIVDKSKAFDSAPGLHHPAAQIDVRCNFDRLQYIWRYP
jgi:hypothetical protein